METCLPSDILIDVFSRLPVGTIISCKCVCKSWLDLVETREVAEFHLSKSKSTPRLSIPVYITNLPFFIKMIEFEDGHGLRYPPITNLHFPLTSPLMEASVDGLLLLNSSYDRHSSLHVCNPITREYINLPCSHPPEFIVVTYGFGVSKITGKYKVVRIIHRPVRINRDDHTLLRVPESDCKVYTIGSASWRSIASDDLVNYTFSRRGTLVNGNLHWFAYDLEGRPGISCFDLETEIFTTFSAPPLESNTCPYSEHIIALEDCLCLCENTSNREMEIWLMQEYGVEKSWTKHFVIRFTELSSNFVVRHPIKIFKDGDMFVTTYDRSSSDRRFFCCYYSHKNRSIHRIDIPGEPCSVSSHAYIPSFLSLKSFRMQENVISY